MIELSVMIPAYMEEENLRLLLPRIRKTLDDAQVSYEILIVDSAQPLDRTEQVCEEFGAKCLRERHGSNFGSAVRTGLEESKGKYILHMDADGSHAPEFIAELLPYRADYDVVVASRYVKGGATENSWALIFMSRMLNWTYSVVLGIDCLDVSTSFKIYHGDELRSLKLSCTHFDIIEEIFVKLRRRHVLKIKEVPFTFKKRMFGDSKRNLVSFIFSYIFTLLKLRFALK